MAMELIDHFERVRERTIRVVAFFKWLAIKFLSRDSQEQAGVIKRDEPAPPPAPSNVAL